MAGCFISGVVHPPLTPPSREGNSLVSGEGYLLCDHSQHAFGIAQNLIVPEPDDAVAVGFDDACAARVGRAFGVLPAVQLDSDAQAPAGEVGDETVNRKLPCEFYATKLAGAQMRPKPFLRFRRNVAQVSRNSGQSLFSQCGTPIPNPLALRAVFDSPQGKGLSIASTLRATKSPSPWGGARGGGSTSVGRTTSLAIHPSPTASLKGSGFGALNAKTH